MTNVQFISLLSTAIGSFVLVILAWINQNQRSTDLRADMNRRFEEAKLNTDRQFDEVNRRFGDIHRQFDEVNRRLTLIEGDQKQFFTVTGKLDGRIDQLSRG